MMKNKRVFTLLAMLVVWIVLYLNLETISNFLVDQLFQLEEGKHLTETIRFFIF